MDFEVGAEASIEVDISGEILRSFIALSGDDAPLHSDEAFAKSRGFKGRLVHGALLVAFVSRFVGTRFPGPRSLLQRMDLQFRKPCYVPCRVQIRGKVRQISESTGSLVLDVTITDESGEAIANGKTYHSLLREDRS